MAKAPFKFDLSEKFPRLEKPPIVEAAIHWQARAKVPLESDTLRSVLASRLPEYPTCEAIQHVALKATVSSPDATPVVEHQKDWKGFRLTSSDQRQIVQFKRDGVVFSRTQEYEDWDPFTTAAKKVWRAFVEIAAPKEIQRLGVRFINHISGATPERLEEFLREPPTRPANLPLKEFVYQSTFVVPEQPYEIRVIKVMQPTIEGLPQSSGLFIDCDVFATRPIECDEAAVDDALVRMRWLKNKIFFSLLAESAIRSFQ